MFAQGRETLQTRVPRVDIMLASYEAVVQDLSALQGLPWEAVVLDLRSETVLFTPPRDRLGRLLLLLMINSESLTEHSQN